MVWLPWVDLEREKHKEYCQQHTVETTARSSMVTLLEALGAQVVWRTTGRALKAFTPKPHRMRGREMLRWTLAPLVAVPKAAGSQWCRGMWRHLEMLSWYLPSSYSRGDQKPTLQGCPGQHLGLKLHQQICVSATVWKRFPPGLPTRHSKNRWVEMVWGVEWLRWFSPIASQQTLNLSNGFTSFKRS